MIEREPAGLSLTRQCRLLELSRSSVYYRPVGESAQTLALMRRIDELIVIVIGASPSDWKVRLFTFGATDQPSGNQDPRPVQCGRPIVSRYTRKLSSCSFSIWSFREVVCRWLPCSSSSLTNLRCTGS